ncbi:MAG: spiro-SPASM protein [Spirochaetae bacterium HGW-Spirochaetae-3]|jgi:spiro-SPASM protein|nr:MAG: spiro-SPASM protein [Spirochaetae bacterium HGW-Spirochaetae-3]
METLAIINATSVNEFATRPLAGGPSALARAETLARSVAGGNILVLASSPLPDTGLPTVLKPSWSMHDVLSEAAAFASSKPESDTVLYLQGDAPFVDAALTDTLLELHRRYRAEYTFADGYPPGFAPELLAVKTLPNLVGLAAKHDVPVDRDGLFAVIQKDINSYDIETHLSPVDLRAYRFSPVCDSKRNALSAERLWNLGARSAADAVRLLPVHPELLRTVPAFMWVQVAEGCPQACSYCPYPMMVGDPRSLSGVMPTDRFERLMADAEALCDDLVVDVSLWGEPSLHPDFQKIADSVMARPRFTLIVETSGVGWPAGAAEAVAKKAGARVQWIVSLDDEDDAGYRSLRGERRDEAIAFADRMIGVSPGNVHVQAVRMRDNEPRLESFYRGWKKRGDKVIVQKYDSFAGCLPDRTVAELSPLDRLPCRHLARDIAVLIDGRVPNCKHCLVRGADSRLEYAGSAGNAFDDGLETTWNRMGAWYERHLASDYPEPCGRCDEYHTFNA